MSNFVGLFLRADGRAELVETDRREFIVPEYRPFIRGLFSDFPLPSDHVFTNRLYHFLPIRIGDRAFGAWTDKSLPDSTDSTLFVLALIDMHPDDVKRCEISRS